MNRRLLIVALFVLLAGVSAVSAFTITGSVTGGQPGLSLKMVVAIPTSLDTIYLTVVQPITNTYALNVVQEGGYLLFAYQDLNVNLMPDVDEPRGFYGGVPPQVLMLTSDTAGINIELLSPNNGGFSGAVTYDGDQRGTTIIAAFDNPAFSGAPRGLGAVLDTSGVGRYMAIVDTFGVYYVSAFMDLNLNFAPDPNEPFGIHGGETPLPVTITPGNFPDNVDIHLADPSAAPPLPRTPPRNLSLISVYPNPFNSAATIAFALGSASRVELTAYDLLGREALRTKTAVLSAGEHRLTFDGDALPSGVYLVRLQAEGEAVVTKVLLLR